ncbi:hypothetical protein Q5424_13895 [Conexibacter sp. JD483]|uniref:hypothetical protein n=1 Tax=unclassified Conexibacter TaxID=2627773 RepID=UPI0027200BD6|nr:MULTISPECIES: hypothetical protein [unclassified Conexibacter]MDO8185502.1 hypothetical protein [Conexibacter sp. CPCC 205706]MDO8197311.1 hypothetical protein [Conexibacter sp. CPCC 205762]MDR9370189.1 hypothetical protein [Conexibacter sp. JD483]
MADPPTPAIHCVLSVVGTLLWAGDLEPTRASRPFAVRLDQFSAEGVLTAGWLDPAGQHGQLIGSGCLFTAPAQSLRFDGTLAVW